MDEQKTMSHRQILNESIRTGSIAALAMMPFGFAFRDAGLRVGHYGPKFAELYVNEASQFVLMMQHFVLGWISALPLVIFLIRLDVSRPQAIRYGVVYGIVYYVLVNSLGLPIFFGDDLPWSLGVWTVIPSLVTHIVFGFAVGLFVRLRQLD